jgi:lysozyme
MQPSAATVQLVKASEGLRLVAYQDGGGVWTIGYGHTDGVHAGMRITAEQADEFLAADLATAGRWVGILVKVPLTQGQFDALTDFVFNLGDERLRASTLLRLLNARQYSAAAAQFRFWNLDKGQVEEGLVKRRAAETALFNSAPIESFAGVTGGVIQ